MIPPVRWSRWLAVVAVATATSDGLVAQSAPRVFAPPGRVQAPPPDYGTYEPPSEVTIRGATADAERPAASRLEFPEHGPCRWLPWNAPRDLGPGNARRTSAEFAGQQRVFDQLLQRLKAVPIAKPPVGWCPGLASVAFLSTVDLGHALRTRSTLRAWPATDLWRDPSGRLVFDGEVRGMDIDINRPLVDSWSQMTDTSMVDADGRFFVEVPIIGTFQGFPVYAGNHLVVARREVPLQRPVSLERVLRWWIRADSSWLASLAPDRSAGTRERLTARLAESRAQLAGLDAATRAAPGCLATDGSGGIMRVVPRDAASCRRPIAERNPDLYDRSLPRWAPQIITVSAVTPFENGPPADQRPSQRQIPRWAATQLIWGIDWQQVRREFLGAP